jgi:hypothetical protein
MPQLKNFLICFFAFIFFPTYAFSVITLGPYRWMNEYEVLTAIAQGKSPPPVEIQVDSDFLPPSQLTPGCFCSRL